MHQNGGSYTKREWLELKEYYGNRCLRCGRTEEETTLTVDHVIPISLGGRNDISNLQPLCPHCNSHKGSKYIDYRNRVHLQRLCGEEHEPKTYTYQEIL
ncbi:MAG: HNH endonuclease [Tissierella sp.]|nr:HNH endonuclease [Tissierella sp.]